MTKKHINNKIIAQEFIESVYAAYPEWKGPNLTLPAPVSSPKLAQVDLSRKAMAQVPIPEIQKSVLCGTILADSSIRIGPKYKNARIQVKHSTRQAAWFTWKYLVLLKDYCQQSGVNFYEADGYQVESPLRPGEEVLGKLHLYSRAVEPLTQLHDVICVNGIKTIKRSWLNHMNSYFLMTIWLDDGSLYNKRQGLISFNSTPVDQQQVFREYLLTVWDIETKLEIKSTQPLLSNGQPNYEIKIADMDSLERLLRLVAPLIPVREMLYKVCFKPMEPKTLERWKTELPDLVRPEFKQDIIDYYKKIV